MADLVYYLTIFYFLEFHYYTIILTLDHHKFCLFSGDIYLSFGISLSVSIFSVSFVTVSKLFCDEVLETFVILSAILLPIKSPVASAVFGIALFEAF